MIKSNLFISADEKTKIRNRSFFESENSIFEVKKLISLDKK